MKKLKQGEGGDMMRNVKYLINFTPNFIQLHKVALDLNFQIMVNIWQQHALNKTREHI